MTSEGNVHKPDCAREIETFDAISSGAWPDACDDSLRAHVATCAICSDVAEVAGALIDDRDAAMRHAPVPPSGVVWWRMQMRARNEAALSARRTVIAVQAAVFAAVLGIALAILGNTWWDKLPHVDEIAASGLVVVTQWGVPLLLAIAIWLTLAPVAVWLAVAKD
jgi:heme A synthase